MRKRFLSFHILISAMILCSSYAFAEETFECETETIAEEEIEVVTTEALSEEESQTAITDDSGPLIEEIGESSTEVCPLTFSPRVSWESYPAMVREYKEYMTGYTSLSSCVSHDDREQKDIYTPMMVYANISASGGEPDKVVPIEAEFSVDKPGLVLMTDSFSDPDTGDFLNAAKSLANVRSSYYGCTYPDFLKKECPSEEPVFEVFESQSSIDFYFMAYALKPGTYTLTLSYKIYSWDTGDVVYESSTVGHMYVREPETQIIPATCTSPEQHVFFVDGKEVDREKVGKPLGHSYGKWKQTRAATAKSEGRRERVCSRCKKKEIQTISKTSSALSVSAKGLKNNKLRIKKGSSVKLKATANSSVKFTVSDKKILKISQSGKTCKIKAKKVGTATVTVKAAKKKIKIRITVKK